MVSPLDSSLLFDPKATGAPPGALKRPDDASAFGALAKPDAEPKTNAKDELEARVKAAGDSAPRPPAFQQYDYPKMQPLPPPPKQESTGVVEAWGSLAMLAAALGGARSRFHATTALNAAGEALKGLHARDQEAFKNKMEEWKVASENATRLQNYEVQAYRAIMQRANMDFNQYMKMSADEQRRIGAELKAEALSLQNERLAWQIDHGHWEEAFKEQEAREKALNAKTEEERSIADFDKATQTYMRQFFPGGVKRTDVDVPDFNAWLPQQYPELAKRMKVQAPQAPAAVAQPAAPQPDVAVDDKGVRHKYKGTGDRADPSNWEVLQ